YCLKIGFSGSYSKKGHKSDKITGNTSKPSAIPAGFTKQFQGCDSYCTDDLHRQHHRIFDMYPPPTLSPPARHARDTHNNLILHIKYTVRTLSEYCTSPAESLKYH
ncbi:hypothetical protein, partial [Pseudomonas syringae]|uniref:hypothetical protein n=1 Tax=Pseudomonas syringae TaxID=317 RepID=UPI001F396D84